MLPLLALLEDLPLFSHPFPQPASSCSHTTACHYLICTDRAVCKVLAVHRNTQFLTQARKQKFHYSEGVLNLTSVRPSKNCISTLFPCANWALHLEHSATRLVVIKLERAWKWGCWASLEGPGSQCLGQYQDRSSSGHVEVKHISIWFLSKLP